MGKADARPCAEVDEVDKKAKVDNGVEVDKQADVDNVDEVDKKDEMDNEVAVVAVVAVVDGGQGGSATAPGLSLTTEVEHQGLSRPLGSPGFDGLAATALAHLVDKGEHGVGHARGGGVHWTMGLASVDQALELAGDTTGGTWAAEGLTVQVAAGKGPWPGGARAIEGPASGGRSRISGWPRHRWGG